MGFKTSLILIQNPDNFSDDRLLLDTLGMGNYNYVEDTCFDECMYPRDGSINIGYYNNCIVIADDWQLIDKFISEKMHPVEEALMKLFPESEIVSITCHSVVNSHGYALLKDGKKLRAKALDYEKLYFDMGEWLEEEKPIYAKSVMHNGVRVWPDGGSIEDGYREDQMMEEFAFGVGARLLGERIDCMDDYFLDELPFRKYMKQ